MNNRVLRLVVAALIALPVCGGFAEEEKGKGPGPGKGPGGPGFQPPKFAEIDTDASGDVNKEEWTAFQVKMAKERAERSFEFIAGEDGKISEEDLKKMMERRPPGEGPRGPGKGEPKGDAEKSKRPALEQ